MITKYDNGTDYIWYHYDNEPEIAPHSDIVTRFRYSNNIFRRIKKFKGSPLCSDYSEQSLSIAHGDVYIMSRKSQNFFQHSAEADGTTGPRISITFRMLKNLCNFCHHTTNTEEPLPNTEEPLPLSTCNPILEPPQSSHNISPKLNETYTLYIGDSVLSRVSKINPTKMSSESQKAFLFAYPGATAGIVLSKLKNDPIFQSLDPQKVKNIYFLWYK